MAQSVVDALEAVQVQVTDRQAPLLPVSVGPGGAQPFFQQLAVRQACQVIVVGCTVQFPGVVFQGGDIGERGNMVVLAWLLQVNAADGQQLHVLFPVLAPVPDLAAPMIGFSMDCHMVW